jgi:hypothetical protein
LLILLMAMCADNSALANRSFKKSCNTIVVFYF